MPFNGVAEASEIFVVMMLDYYPSATCSVCYKTSHSERKGGLVAQLGRGNREVSSDLCFLYGSGWVTSPAGFSRLPCGF